MAILKPMGTCTLKAMKVRRPSLLLLHSLLVPVDPFLFSV
jgi:hypothetical protein